MLRIFIGSLSAALAMSAYAAGTNLVTRSQAIAAASTNNPEALDKEFDNLMDEDDRAEAEIDQWIRENDEFAAKGAGMPAAQLKLKIQQRLEPVRKAYEDFVDQHPTYTRARIAYASFLGDTKDEESAQEQLEKALALDTNNPAIYNNLANIYGHIGPVKKAFEFYGKAIRLNPLEPVYYHNFGTTVYLFRNDAMEYFNISLAQVFVKTFELYSNAMRLDPDNFPLASDVAQTYYGIQPLRTEEALQAWTNALRIAHDEIEREGVYIHFARIKYMANRLAEARAHLEGVTNETYMDLKHRIQRNITEKENPPVTNSVAPPKTNSDPVIGTERKNASPLK